jgi:ribosomal protein S1
MCSIANLDLLEGFTGQRKVDINELLAPPIANGCFTEAELHLAFQNQKIISGRVIGREGDRLLVDLGCRTGIVPAAEVDPNRAVALDGFVGQMIDFKVIGFEGLSPLLSRKAARREKAVLLLNRIKVGDRLTGIVKVILSYGCFVEIGGVAGLLKNRDIDRRPVMARNVLEIGQCIDVVVKEISRQGRVYLSTRELIDRPGPRDYDRFRVNSRWLGTVVTITDFGVFVNLAPGIDALGSLPATGRAEVGRQVLFKVNQVNAGEGKIHGKILRFL